MVRLSVVHNAMNNQNTLSFRERKRQRVQCQWCIKNFAASYINIHRATAHHDFEYALPALSEALLEDAHVPQSYNISWPRVILHQCCPVQDCPFTSLNAGTLAMYRHFQHKHPFDTINIARDGTRPKCTFCGLQTAFPNGLHHLQSEDC